MDRELSVDFFLRDRLDDLASSTGPEVVGLLAGVRAIADQHNHTCEPGHPCVTCKVPHPCPTLRLLAWAFADHPDFDPTWSVP